MGVVLYLMRAPAERITTLGEDFDLLDEVMSGEIGDEDALIDFDKAWHVVHYLLTGSPGATDSPLSFIIGDWEQINEEFSFVPPDAVRRFSIALSALTDDELRSRYNPGKFADAQLYMSDYFVEAGNDGINYLMQGMPRLRTFATQAAEKGEAVGILTQ